MLQVVGMAVHGPLDERRRRTRNVDGPDGNSRENRG